MISRFRHKINTLSLGSKFLIAFTAIVLVLLTVTLGVAQFFTKSAVRERITRDLNEAQQVFDTFNHNQTSNLYLVANAVADAPLLKSLMGVEGVDHPTLLESLQSLSETVESDMLMLLDPAGKLLARTDKVDEVDTDLSARPDVSIAVQGESASYVWEDGDTIMQVVTVPIQMEERPVGLLSVGTKIDNKTAATFQNMTGAGMAFISSGVVKALAGESAELFSAAIEAGILRQQERQPSEILVLNERYLAVYSTLNEGEGELVSVLVTSVDKAMAFYNRIQTIMLAVGLLAILGAAGLTAHTSRKLIVSPVKQLVRATELVRQGDLSHNLQIRSQDELGVLGANFNHMINDLKISRDTIEDYARNLENKVSERTAELKSANGTITAMINSLQQGFMVVEPSFTVNPVFSKACYDLLNGDPAGREIWDVIPHPGGDPLHLWRMMFEEPIEFDDVVGLAPKTFPHPEGRHISLAYYPKRDDSGVVAAVVVVATDRTSEIKALEAAEHERNFAQMVIRISKNKKQFADFVRLSRGLIADTQREAGQLSPDYELLFRLFHTIKGGSAAFSITTVKDIAHEAENYLYALRRGEVENVSAAIESVRHQAAAMEEHFEAFLQENQKIIGDDIQEHVVQIPMVKLKGFSERLGQLPEGQTWRSLFESEFILEPAQKLCQHFDDMIESLKERLGKEVAPILFTGGELKIRADYYTDLLGSLVHAIRNAVDHGVENPADREEAGKPRCGQITVAFERSRVESTDWFTIKISDDGNGINPARIRAKLVANGAAEESLAIPDEELIQRIFDAGFSTAEQVTETSGRGVGMDAIQHEARKLGGFARVFSRVGEGSTVVVSVPYVEANRSEQNVMVFG